jgi:CubicO group peptidase (beta-lactamase class C family)
VTTSAATHYRPLYIESGPFPGASWEERTPEAVGLRRDSLDALAEHVRGRGCVVRGGYLAYTWGDFTSSVDEPLARFEPGLREINGGKDAAITWRHLASQTSGYGWSEAPGAAWSYNDFALALYSETLFNGVFKADPTEVLRRLIAGPLQFQDTAEFNAEVRPGERRRGRIALSPRDHCRFGLLYLRRGKWGTNQIVQPELIDIALSSVVPADLPATAGVDADMLPGQPSHGGGKRTNDRGPGQYSFNWWLNLPDRRGDLLFPSAPQDAYVAVGLGLTKGLWVIPSLDLLVAWQEANWSSDDKVNPGQMSSVHNTAACFITEACR